MDVCGKAALTRISHQMRAEAVVPFHNPFSDSPVTSAAETAGPTFDDWIFSFVSGFFFLAIRVLQFSAKDNQGVAIKTKSSSKSILTRISHQMGSNSKAKTKE